MAASDGAFRAGVTEPHRIRADMGDAAVFEHDIPGPIGMDGGADLYGGLCRFEAIRAGQILAVFKRQPFELDVFDDLVVGGTALDADELLQPRGDDLHFSHVFAGQGLIIQPAVACQKPFAGGVQKRHRIFQEKRRVGGHGIPRFHWAAFDSHGVSRGVEVAQEFPGDIPFVIGYHLYIFQGLLIDTGQCRGGVRVQLDGLDGSAILHAGLADRLHIMIKLVGCSCPNRPLAIDKKLFEIPLSIGDFGQVGLPDAVLMRLPAGHGHTSAEDGFGSGGGLIDDRLLRLAAIQCGQLKRLRHGINSIGDDDNAYRRFIGFAGPQPANYIACGGQRGQGAVGFIEVGFVVHARPGIIAVGADIDGDGCGVRRHDQHHRKGNACDGTSMGHESSRF